MNPTHPSHTSPCVISGWKDSLSDLLTPWLAVAAQTCVERASQNKMSRWRTSVGMQKLHWTSALQAETWWRAGSCLWRICGKMFERSPAKSMFLSLISKWCHVSKLPHTHQSLKCIVYQTTDRLIHCPYARTHISVQWCTTCMHVRDSCHVCKAPVTGLWALPWYIKPIINLQTWLMFQCCLHLHWPLILSVCGSFDFFMVLTELGVFEWSLLLCVQVVKTFCIIDYTLTCITLTIIIHIHTCTDSCLRWLCL